MVRLKLQAHQDQQFFYLCLNSTMVRLKRKEETWKLFLFLSLNSTMVRLKPETSLKIASL